MTRVILFIIIPLRHDISVDTSYVLTNTRILNQYIVNQNKNPKCLRGFMKSSGFLKYFALFILNQDCSTINTAEHSRMLQQTMKNTNTRWVGFKTVKVSSIEDDDFNSPSHNLSNLDPIPDSINRREACFHAGYKGEFLFNIRFIYSVRPSPNTFKLNLFKTPGLFLAYPRSKMNVENIITKPIYVAF